MFFARQLRGSIRDRSYFLFQDLRIDIDLRIDTDDLRIDITVPGSILVVAVIFARQLRGSIQDSSCLL